MSSSLQIMPPIPWRIKVGNHPGSTVEELKNEPGWGAGHQHRVGYKNRQDRLPGLTHRDDELSDEDLEAIKRFRKLRQDENKGKLVNFRDLVEGQEVLHPFGSKTTVHKIDITKRTFISGTQRTDLLDGATFSKPPKTGSRTRKNGQQTSRSGRSRRKLSRRKKMRKKTSKKMGHTKGSRSRNWSTSGSGPVSRVQSTTMHMPQEMVTHKSRRTTSPRTSQTARRTAKRTARRRIKDQNMRSCVINTPSKRSHYYEPFSTKRIIWQIYSRMTENESLLSIRTVHRYPLTRRISSRQTIGFQDRQI